MQLIKAITELPDDDEVPLGIGNTSNVTVTVEDFLSDVTTIVTKAKLMGFSTFELRDTLLNISYCYYQRIPLGSGTTNTSNNSGYMLTSTKLIDLEKVTSVKGDDYSELVNCYELATINLPDDLLDKLLASEPMGTVSTLVTDLILNELDKSKNNVNMKIAN